MATTYALYNDRRARLMRAPLWRRLAAPAAPLWAKRAIYLPASSICHTGRKQAGSALALDADYAEGVDVSHWQGAINWPVMAPLVRFAYIKATDSTFVDSYFATSAAGSQAAGVPRGFYHFVRSSPSGIEQAKYFISAAKNKAGGLGELPLALDVEVSLPVALVKDCAYTIVGQLGYWPLIYCSKYTWEGLLVGSRSEKAWAAACPLWVASWDTLLPSLPYTWTDWAIQQYSSKGDGGKYGVSSASIDLDRAKTAWLAKYIPITPPPPPPSPFPQSRIVLASALNIRSGPDAASADVGTLQYGSDVTVTETQGDWGKLAEGWINLKYTGLK